MVERIITAPAFRAVARNLHDADQTGWDTAAILHALPVDKIDTPTIRNPAAYTATLIDTTIQTWQQHSTPDAEMHQQRLDQAADLLREAWAIRPHLAERVIAAAAFPALARTLDRYHQLGLDARELLQAIPPATVTRATVNDPAAYTTYLIHTVADARLTAHAAAAEPALSPEELDDAAQLLTDAWHHAPDAARHVITAAGFTFLAARMFDAHDNGHDVHAVLVSLDPTALTTGRLPNPAGPTTHAFALALGQQPTPADSSPAPGTTTAPETAEPTVAAPPAPALPNSDAAKTAERAVYEVPEAAQPTTPHWTQREHGRLDDDSLGRRIHAEQRQLERLARQHAAATQEAAQLRDRAIAGTGPNVTSLDADLASWRELATAIRRAEHLETQRRTAVADAVHAAEQRALAEHDRNTLGRFATGRRAELDRRIDEHHSQEERAHATARRSPTSWLRYMSRSVRPRNAVEVSPEQRPQKPTTPTLAQPHNTAITSWPMPRSVVQTAWPNGCTADRPTSPRSRPSRSFVANSPDPNSKPSTSNGARFCRPAPRLHPLAERSASRVTGAPARSPLPITASNTPLMTGRPANQNAELVSRQARESR